MKEHLTSETELARVVVTELQRQGYETYEEVSMGYGSHRADIVAVLGPIVCVVECKMSLGFALFDQLLRWRGKAHRIIAAVKPVRVRASVIRVFTSEGFGLWACGYEEIAVHVAPRLHRTADVRWVRKRLRPEMQSQAYAKAGSQGGYWTPFRGTVSALKEIAKKQPGIELRVALREAKHHYANQRSALSSIPELIRRGVITGLRVEGRPLCLYADAEPTP